MTRLLFIDDNESFRHSAATVLRRAGYDVVEASDGADGLAKADEGIDLVVSDIIMPNTDGVQAIAALRERLPHVPILAISGGDIHSPTYLKVAAMVGATRVLAKPFAPAVFLRTISEMTAATPPSA